MALYNYNTCNIYNKIIQYLRFLLIKTFFRNFILLWPKSAQVSIGTCEAKCVIRVYIDPRCAAMAV